MRNKENALKEMAAIYHEGEDLYHQIKELRPEDTDIIICPEHLGDTIWVVVFARAYIESHQCSQVYFAVKESQNEIVNCFPDVSGTIVLSDEEMLRLRIYITIEKLWNKDHIVYAHFEAHLEYEDGDGAAFSVNQYTNESTMIKARLRWLDIEGAPEASRMNPLDDGNNIELRELFHKSVLFMPTAQSVKAIPDTFWIRLADSYSEAGYKVYTNYNGFPYEQMIEGTVPLASSIVELAKIAPYFAQVIALRSGACDLLAETTANLSILYNSEINVNKVKLEPADVTWESIYVLVKRDGMHSYQYLPSMEDELIEALKNQIEF